MHCGIAIHFLRSSSGYANRIVYKDWQTKKHRVSFLDVINVVELYWNQEFKHKPSEFKSEFIFVEWPAQDALAPLFALSFGHFPQDLNLKDDFVATFINGLRSKKASISSADCLPSELADSVSPISSTAKQLRIRAGIQSGDGIFAGDPNLFEDLLAFLECARQAAILLSLCQLATKASFAGLLIATLKGSIRHPLPIPISLIG